MVGCQSFGQRTDSFITQMVALLQLTQLPLTLLQLTQLPLTYIATTHTVTPHIDTTSTIQVRQQKNQNKLTRCSSCSHLNFPSAMPAPITTQSASET
jgi:hypothetical protein